MKSISRLAVLLGVFFSGILLPAQVSAPQVGVVRYATGDVYPVLGVAGNYLVGSPLCSSAEAVAFSDLGGLLLRQGTLFLVDSNLKQVAAFEIKTPDLVLGIEDDPLTAIAWSPATQALVFWNGQTFSSISAGGSVPEGVFHVRRDKRTATLLSRSPSGAVEETQIDLESGAFLSRSSLAGLEEAPPESTIFRHAKHFLFAAHGQLVIVSPDTGTRKTFPLRSADLRFERASNSTVHLHSASTNRDWLLQFTNDQVALFELPTQPKGQSASQQTGLWPGKVGQ